MADTELWRQVSQLKPETIRALDAWRTKLNDPAAVEPGLLERSVRCVVQGDDEYPQRLYDLPQPPLVLFVRSAVDLRQLFHRDDVVGIVGTRRASSYAEEATRWIAGTIARAGWHIVSGLALGVDVFAHESAIAEQGPTSAVLACGPDLCYPVNHKRTYDNILRSGCIISEYAPGTPVAKHRFPERNRLIAALTSSLIVVQAGEKSGALGTAGFALDLGRDVYAVPGPITSTHYRGSNRLLADGAAVLLDPQEFLLDHGQTLLPHRLGNVPPERWQALYEALEEPLGAQVLADTLSVPLSHVYAGLLELELAGLIKRQPGAVYGRKS